MEEDQNFTTARNRFASESIFVFIDLKSIENEEKLQRQKWEKDEQKRAAAEAANPPKVEETVEAELEHQPPPLQELPPPPAPEPSIAVNPPSEVITDDQPSSTATLGSGPPPRSLFFAWGHDVRWRVDEVARGAWRSPRF